MLKKVRGKKRKKEKMSFHRGGYINGNDSDEDIDNGREKKKKTGKKETVVIRQTKSEQTKDEDKKKENNNLLNKVNDWSNKNRQIQLQEEDKKSDITTKRSFQDVVRDYDKKVLEEENEDEEDNNNNDDDENSLPSFLRRSIELDKKNLPFTPLAKQMKQMSLKQMSLKDDADEILSLLKKDDNTKEEDKKRSTYYYHQLPIKSLSVLTALAPASVPTFSSGPQKLEESQEKKERKDGERKLTISNNTTPVGQLVMTHADGKIKEYNHYLQAYTDDGKVWGEITSLCHIPGIIDYLRPPAKHCPIITNKNLRVDLVVHLSYKPISIIEDILTSKFDDEDEEQSYPSGSATFGITCFPIHKIVSTDEGRNISKKIDYHCRITNGSMKDNVIKDSNSRSIVVHNNIYFEVEVFPNVFLTDKGQNKTAGNKIASNILKIEPLKRYKVFDILYFDFRVGYQPSIKHCSLFEDKDKDKNEDGKLKDRKKQNYRLLWTAKISKTPQEI